MAKYVVLDMKMDNAIKSLSGPLEVMKPPTNMKFYVAVEFDNKIEKGIGNDPLMQDKLKAKVRTLYDSLVRDIGANLKKTDKGGQQLRDQNKLKDMQKLIDVVNKNLLGAQKIAEDKAEKLVMDTWNEFKRNKSDYTKY